MEIHIKKIKEDATVPSYAHKGDAGMDLFAAAETTVDAGARTTVPTGVAMEIPNGYAGLIWDKSGVSLKRGLKTIGGVVDASYRGEVMVGIANISDVQQVIQKGEKIAQMLIQPVEAPDITEADTLSDTTRGSGGYGSTGEK